MQRVTALWGLVGHLAREAAKVRGDGGESAKAEEGIKVEDGHAAAAGQLVQLHAEPGNVHHRLHQRWNQRRQVIAQSLHVARHPLVHILCKNVLSRCAVDGRRVQEVQLGGRSLIAGQRRGHHRTQRAGQCGQKNMPRMVLRQPLGARQGEDSSIQSRTESSNLTIKASHAEQPDTVRARRPGPPNGFLQPNGQENMANNMGRRVAGIQ